MANTINQAIYKLIKRAEKQDKEHLIRTFVDVGPLLVLLTNPDHQIVYGRRGTGKTHALSYLNEWLLKENFAPVYIDMRQVGSNGGIYSDLALDFTERASRLLIDTFGIIHDQILDFVLNNDVRYDLSIFGPLLDELKVAISEIQVVGSVEREDIQQKTTAEDMGAKLNFSPQKVDLSISANASATDSATSRVKIGGKERHRIHFTTISNIFTKLKSALREVEIWILIDEWAEIPHDLQPYLGDLLRRTLCPIKGITIKIAAIEKRSNFKAEISNGYIGIETGADFSASINLDEFMVFENDAEKSKDFFAKLLYNHVNQFMLEAGQSLPNVHSFIQSAFTQNGAFEELVRASEGIPRDAINILVQSAIKADNDKISIPHVRAAARSWFTSDKERSVNSNAAAKVLLRWVIDEVIGKRNSRAFLISADLHDSIIEYLFDNRILHLIKQNISSKDRPGERFNVFSIDYGTYVHLINTNDEPKGLFFAIEDIEEIHIEVPINDYRSIRRAILDLDVFYDKYPELKIDKIV